MVNKINLAEKFDQFHDTWNPRVIAALNGQQVKLVRVEGEFIWHHHDQEDELFLVIAGRLTIQFEDGSLTLEPGELCVIPHGVEHKPVAEPQAQVLLLEPASTLNTGNVRNERTVDTLETL